LGSAVIDCLSLNTLASRSRITSTGLLQVSPPSSDLLASSAWSKSLGRNGGAMSLNDSASWWTTPSGPNDTQGSVDRS
jgi:hypothetical protein